MEDGFTLLLSEQRQKEIIKNTNAYTHRFGLSLTEPDIQELMMSRRECLSRHQRVEFGKGILEKLIFAFCDSEYIYQGNYVETIERLQHIFYLYKNECMDEWTDEELIDRMRDAFDGVCQGSLEYLEETCLEQFAREARAKSHNGTGMAAGTVKKSGVAEIYTLEELIPVVGELAEKYTSRESSSIPYERAIQLMDAAIFCISHVEWKDTSLLSHTVLPAREAYQIGYEAVVAKVRKTQEKYNALIRFFDSYGNQNYRDTVEKALPGFFLYYDARFFPTDSIITMDYPVFEVDRKLEGIDIISQYIDAIWEEQCYLMKFPRNYIISELRSFHPRYEKEFFNLKEILQLQMATGNSD